MTGSGRCASHNVRLVRDIVQRKQSFVKKCGGIGWRLCDFAILVCPTKLSSAAVTSDVYTKTSPNRTGETTNKRTGIPGSEMNDQSPAGPKKMRNNS